MLLRTVTGVLSQSPPHLIKEVIIVDDASTFEYLGRPLDSFIKRTPKTRIIRHTTRKGLIHARMAGAKAATGDVLVFLDAHIEVGKVWLEPVLDYLKKNPRTLLSPVADTIDAESFEWHYHVDIDVVSAFTWDLFPLWIGIQSDWKIDRSSIANALPMYSTMGCALAVNRKVFMELGSWDEEMPSVWGGENTEIVWRYWMCGGEVKALPCSRLGHLLRLISYYIPEPPEKNLQRIAELWMGDYLPFYYASIHMRYQLSETEKKSLDKRKQFLASIQCHDLRWFLENVLPDMFIPWRNATFQGQIKSAKSGKCLSVDHQGFTESIRCDQWNHRTYFYYTYDKRIFLNSSHCLIPRNDDGILYIAACTSTATEIQQWDMVLDVLPEVKYMTSRKRCGGWRGKQCPLLRIESNVAGIRKCMTVLGNDQDIIRGHSAQCESNKLQAHWYVTYNMDFSIWFIYSRVYPAKRALSAMRKHGA